MVGFSWNTAPATTAKFASSKAAPVKPPMPPKGTPNTWDPNVYDSVSGGAPYSYSGPSGTQAPITFATPTVAPVKPMNIAAPGVTFATPPTPPQTFATPPAPQVGPVRPGYTGANPGVGDVYDNGVRPVPRPLEVDERVQPYQDSAKVAALQQRTAPVAPPPQASGNGDVAPVQGPGWTGPVTPVDRGLGYDERIQPYQDPAKVAALQKTAPYGGLTPPPSTSLPTPPVNPGEGGVYDNGVQPVDRGQAFDERIQPYQDPAKVATLQKTGGQQAPSGWAVPGPGLNGGGATPQAPSWMSFMVANASDAIAKMIKKYQGRDATPQEIDQILRGGAGR